jgi:hypothetical protein
MEMVTGAVIVLILPACAASGGVEQSGFHLGLLSARISGNIPFETEYRG